MPDVSPSQLCRSAIGATERITRIPDAFLNAISRVETGRQAAGAVDPWPWTINAAGTGHFYASKAEAIAAARAFMAQGVRSLDVGCLQVSLLYHPEAFASLDQAFDPATNAAFAGQLLMALFRQTGSWPRAAAAYHSLTPSLGEAYERKVLEAWAVPDRPALRPASTQAPELIHHGDDQAARQPTPSLPGTIAPPAFGFTRRFMMPHPGLATGKSLADYRAMRIRLSLQAPDRGAALPGLRRE
jgi:hypothetical protein